MNYNTMDEKIAREEPLARRIIDALVRNWLNTGFKFAEATSDTEAHRQGALNMYGHLDEFWIHLTPYIIDELERAGLLKKNANEN